MQCSNNFNFVLRNRERWNGPFNHSVLCAFFTATSLCEESLRQPDFHKEVGE